MFKANQSFFFIALILILTSACSKDDPDDVDGEELITTLNYTLSPIGGGTDVLLSFKDLDGDGGNEAVITNGVLMANTTYNGSLELLNESLETAEDITLEIQEEKETHQFFFQSDIADLSVSYEDQDADGNPVGLSSQLVTGMAASGTLTVILRHEPNKSGEGVSDGGITNAGGETDIEVSFSIDVQ